MIRHTANYSNSNHNFVIQNLSDERKMSDLIPAICIIKNILSRGKPTFMSSYLINEIGEIHKLSNFDDFVPLISEEKPIWQRIIRGDTKGNYNPAKHFFDTLIPKYFEEFPFLSQLIIPEVPINFITQVEVDDFAYQQVDFYLPQAFLVIEIDGSQHDIEKDKLRDFHLKKFGIETYRFTTKEIESESEDFKTKVDKIKSRIVKVSDNIANKNDSNSLEEYVPTIYDYHNEIVSKSSDIRLIATAIIRFQLTILDMLESGKIDFKRDIQIELKTDFIDNFESWAISDLQLWFENLLQLQKINLKFPLINIQRVNKFSNTSKIKIDFSIHKRYTDEFQNNPDVIYVRTDYFDHFLHYKSTDAVHPVITGFKSYDFFTISTCEPIKYRFQFQNDTSKGDEEALGFIMDTLFGYKSFRDGQLSIIINALQLNSTLGLLPTGGGKSICFQLPVFLQPGISFVVCPIKALMFDQKIDLQKRKITRIEHITSENSSEDKNLILNDFSNGKYQFIFIAPERFQIMSFRQYLQKLADKFTISYAVIDEVHCLSEWGHDFRTSYLNLSKTINKYCSSTFRFIALTATASLNVLKDIKLELNIKDDDVKTLTDYTRPELEFEVISDRNQKYNKLKEILENENAKNNVFDLNGNNSNAGIIFTTTVNGYAGCANIANSLSYDLGFKVDYFSGSPPKINGLRMTNEEFEMYKNKVQQEFKSNKLSLLVATKAFGMGVNKNNVSYTIHYGIPGSLESLYQEAGRAGRDKQRYINDHARCYVLFSESNDIENLDFLWNRNTSISDLKRKVNEIDGDLKSNFYMLQTSLEEEEVEFRIINKIISKYAAPGAKEVLIQSSQVKTSITDDEGNDKEIGNKAYTERAIYRLTQLGIVDDWTVKNFFLGEFEVDFLKFDEDSVRYSLIETISKYSDKNEIDRLINIEFNKTKGKTKIEKTIYTLLHWVNGHFVYNRRQSLKNIYEACANFQKGDFDKRKLTFKNSLENYFKFNESTFILQHITENSYDYKKWFEVFYELKTENQTQFRTNKIIDLEEINKLQNNLSRFLESYANNIGLNFISGMLRLLNDDFENSDGKDRILQSFNSLKVYEWKLNDENIKEYLIKESCEIINHFNLQIKNTFAKFMIELFERDIEVLNLVNSHLDDDYTTSYILKNYNKRLQKINKNINEEFKRIK